MLERPTDYRFLPVSDAIEWNDVMDATGTSLLYGWGGGSFLMTIVWALHLPIFFLNGWGAGPNEVTFDLFAKYWIWIVMYFSVCTAIAGTIAGARKYREKIDVDLSRRQDQWGLQKYLTEHPEESDLK